MCTYPHFSSLTCQMICSQSIQTSILATMECKQVDYRFYPAESGSSSSHWTSVRKTYSISTVCIYIDLAFHSQQALAIRFHFQRSHFTQDALGKLKESHGGKRQVVDILPFAMSQRGAPHLSLLLVTTPLLTHHPCLLNYKRLKKKRI